MSDKKKFSIIKPLQIEHYHLVPGETERNTISPEREEILKYISKIPYKKFPEFILDILIHVEGHKAVDITDGPGDEKQDILTLTPDGERHLTQCKHKVDHTQNFDGDELDLLLGACIRKNCSKAAIVANSDFTPQAKRYVNDKEYLRGTSQDKSVYPEIDYWNGAKIWDRIAYNQNILNKWFSGLGQTQSL